MNYVSVCSGIEAATVAWHPLGWTPRLFAEIDKFPSRVLAHHYPEVQNIGDFTKITQAECGPIDILIGGTPCQDFSVAGLRAGMDGDRGQLTIEYARLAGRLRPRWLCWENVPGVLSSDGGRAFGTFLGILGQLGYGIAYRILDAQYLGVPQRRRRVFVVGYLGDWRRAAAVLFERHSLQGDNPPRRETGQDVAPTISARTHGGGGLGTDFDCDGGLIAKTLLSFGHTANPLDESLICLSSGQANAEVGIDRAPTLNCLHEAPIVTHALRADGFDASEDGTGRGTPLVPWPQQGYRVQDAAGTGETITSNAHGGMKISPILTGGMAVRRLTPRECERLQGFPDDYTRIDAKTADGPRYKALGNSMAVPVMRWIGERIAMVEAL